MKQKILIGPVNKKDIGSIPTLNRAFMSGLSEAYSYTPFNVNRKYGKSKVSALNVINLFYFVKHYFILIIQLIRHRPDIFQYAITSNWNFEKSLLFLHTAKFLGVRRVAGHLHGGSFDFFMNNLKAKRKKRALKLLNSIDVVIVASEYWKTYLKEINITTLIEVVNNPIDTQYVSEISKIKKNQRNNTFLFVGSLGKRKGFYDILEVLKSIDKSFVLKAVGSEDRKNDLNKIYSIIKEEKLSSQTQIIVSEKMNLEDKVNYFTKSAVFLFPSHNENFPLVIIEAACAGLPIISTRVGAVPEFFEHMKNIFFVEPGNLLEIKEAIEFMISNPDERKRLGIEARKTYDELLSEEIIMNQLNKVYKKLLS